MRDVASLSSACSVVLSRDRGRRDYSSTSAAPPVNWLMPEDHELGRLHRRDADLADDLAGLDHLGRVGLGVALDEERLRGRGAEQRARRATCA